MTGLELFTGDTVLGRGTTVIAEPDGDLEAYLTSLERLRAVAAKRTVRRLLPGHGPVIEDPLTVLNDYLAHRQERLDAGARGPTERSVDGARGRGHRLRRRGPEPVAGG